MVWARRMFCVARTILFWDKIVRVLKIKLNYPTIVGLLSQASGPETAVVDGVTWAGGGKKHQTSMLSPAAATSTIT